MDAQPKVATWGTNADDRLPGFPKRKVEKLLVSGKAEDPIGRQTYQIRKLAEKKTPGLRSRA